MTILFDAGLIQTGFYPAEQGGEGPFYRWLGPEPVATITLPRLTPRGAGGRHHHLRVHSRRHRCHAPIAGWGEWVGVDITRASDTVASATLTAGPGRGGTTMQLSIDVGRTESPVERGGQDKRKLSVAISTIDLRPV